MPNRGKSPWQAKGEPIDPLDRAVGDCVGLPDAADRFPRSARNPNARSAAWDIPRQAQTGIARIDRPIQRYGSGERMPILWLAPSFAGERPDPERFFLKFLIVLAGANPGLTRTFWQRIGSRCPKAACETIRDRRHQDSVGCSSIPNGLPVGLGVRQSKIQSWQLAGMFSLKRSTERRCNFGLVLRIPGT